MYQFPKINVIIVLQTYTNKVPKSIKIFFKSYATSNNPNI